jgi:hypothetical protein
MLTEEELIAAIKNRTKHGAEALYDNYALQIYKVINCNAVEEDLVEQVFENVFQKIWNSFYEFDEQQNRLSVWILGTARAISKTACTETITMRNRDSEDDGLEFTVKPV